MIIGLIVSSYLSNKDLIDRFVGRIAKKNTREH